MRRFLIAPCVSLALTSSALAQAGTPKTVTDLNTEVNALLPDNTVGAITPLAVRQVFVDIVASYGNLSSSSVFTAPPSVPTAAFGTNTTQAASTAFVQANGGGAFLNNLPPFTTPCNPTGITAAAIACPAIVAAPPLSIVGTTIAANVSDALFNVYVGGAGNLTGTGISNTAIGAFTFNTNTTGSNNTVIGENAMAANLGGAANMALGQNALTHNTSGNSNVGVGQNSLTANTIGVSNTGLGTSSLAANISGGFNVGIGYQSLLAQTTSSGNSALGQASLADVTTGQQNTGIGNSAGRGITTGSNNTIVGAQCSGFGATSAGIIVLCTGDGTPRIDWNNTTASTWTQLRTNFSERFYTTYGTPTIASGACGTGTNGVITSGHNQAGLVTIGAAATTTCTINFSTTFSTIPDSCVIFPANAAAAATGTTIAYVSSISTTQWVITGSALANAAYRYICI